MDKTKKTIISLFIALVILLILSFIISTGTNSNYLEIPVFSKDLLKGSKITDENVTTIKIKSNDETKKLYQNTVTLDEAKAQVVSKDVYNGEIITKDKIVLDEQQLVYVQDYEYISIPVGSSSYATSNKLKRGDKIIIYFTAKNKEISKAISDTKKIYSSDNVETLVTSRLLENVEVVSTHNNAGSNSEQSIVTDILVRLQKDQAMLIANLKSQGTFEIVLTN